MASDRRANPFSEGDVPEMMKREILYWSHKLEVSPSKLFALTDEELDNRLRIIQEKSTLERRRRDRNERLLKLSEMKRNLIDASVARAQSSNEAEHRTIWQVLGQAAVEIQNNYTQQDSSSHDRLKLTGEKTSHFLSNDQVSELTKKEIMYWSQQLKISPSTLCSYTQEELNDRLREVQVKEQMEKHRQMRNNRLQKLSSLKKYFEDVPSSSVEDTAERTRGGSDRRDIWEILAQAADEIERNYRPTISNQPPAMSVPARNYRLDRIQRSIMEPFSHNFHHQNAHVETQVRASNANSRMNASPESYNCTTALHSAPAISSTAANSTQSARAGKLPRSDSFDGDEEPSTSSRSTGQRYNRISSPSSSPPRQSRRDISPANRVFHSTSGQAYDREVQTSEDGDMQVTLN